MTKKKATPAPELIAVETLRVKCKIPGYIHDGTCIRNGWSKGRMLTEKEYRYAVEEFLAGRTGGKE